MKVRSRTEVQMPGMGPIVLFDKSALQILTNDEAVWFDALHLPSMTPLFFVETFGRS